MSKWKPIETAPKDGTRFLAFACKDEPGMDGRPGGVFVGFMAYGRVVELNNGDYCDGGYGNDYARTNVSHWMPLPDPPPVDEERGTSD